MKKMHWAGAIGALMISSSAMAADADVRVASPPAYRTAFIEPAFSWTGIYIGGHVGFGLTSPRWTDPVAGSRDLGGREAWGALGGGQVGFNWQLQSIVVGAELEGSWADLEGDHQDVSVLINPNTLSSQVNGIATATGRVGVAFKQLLIYAKAGGAWVREKYWVTDFTGTRFATASADRSGWTVGAGYEYGFTPNWSVKLEYAFLSFGDDSATFACGRCARPFNLDIQQDMHQVKVGVNYRFGLATTDAPLAARY